MSRLVISPKAQVRWVDGGIEIASLASQKYLRATDPDVVIVLNSFATPAEPEEVVRRFEGIDPGDLQAAIEGFQAIGVLVSEQVAGLQAEEATAVPGTGSTEELLEWEEFYAQLQKRREGLEFLKYDDLGLTVSNCGKEKLSRGCQSCKDGGWVCFYPGFRCNAHCTFCPQPAERRCRDEEAWGTQFIDDLLVFLQDQGSRITGLSISGGETFLYQDAAEKVLAFARDHLPDVYLWAYTNGIIATPERMKALREAGLEELRFDLAATGFADKIIRLIGDHAVKIFPWVTVEVPALEETYHHLVEKGKLAALAEMGVKQLNLAQLCVPPEATTSPAYRNYYRGDREFYRFESFKPGSGGDLYSVKSRWITYDIFEYADKNRLPIRINDCSSEAKEVQRLARAMNWGPDLLTMKLHSYPHLAAPPDVAAVPLDARRSRTGLAYKTLKPGTGQRRPGPEDYVTVHYTGWTTDGLMFDSSLLRDSDFTVSLRNVIPGWAEGVQSMVVGEKRRLWIPEKLAYAGQPGRPQGMLVFDIELIDIP